MKKAVVLLCMSMFLLQGVYSQNSTEEETQKTLPNMKQELEAWLENVPEYLKYFDPFLSIESDVIAQDDLSNLEYEVVKPLKIYPKADIQAKLKDCYTGKSFYQSVIDTFSTIELYDKDCAIYLLENSNLATPIEANNATIQKIFYRNGKVENAEYPVSFTLPSRMIVDSFAVRAQLSYPVNIKKITLSAKKNVVKEGQHTFKVVKSDKQKILFEVEKPEGLKILSVQGKLADGRLITSYNNLVYDAEMQKQKEFFMKSVDAVKNIVAKIDNKKITTIEEVESLLVAVGLFQAGDEILSDQTYIPSHLYVFNHSVESFEVYFADQFEKQEVSTFISRADLNEDSNCFPAIVTSEEEGSTYGLIDANGEWIVQPAYSNLYRSTDNFFYTYNDDYVATLLIYNEKKKTLEKSDYENVGKLASNRYQVTKSDKGAVINKEGAVIIQILNGGYVSYHENHKLFEVTDGVGSYLYDFDGKLKFPEKVQNVQLQDKEFLSFSPIAPKVVYNAQMKKISDDTWVETNTCYEGSNLLYVKNLKGEEFFVNTKGEVVVKPNSAYRIEAYSSQIFKNEMCAVYASDSYKYGCIDVKGNLVIPMEYDVIYSFGDTYVCAQKDDETFFIDRKGQVKKKIEAGLYTYDYEGGDYSKIVYTMMNGEVYDTEGNFLRKRTDVDFSGEISEAAEAVVAE